MKIAVLTGAGFSRVWDGLLAREFGEHIHSSPALEHYKAVRHKLLTLDYDYEQVLHDVRDMEAFAPFMQAMDDCFKLHDELIKTTCEGFPCFMKLLADLYDAANGEFRFYTLNQDLLVERHADWKDRGIAMPMHCPGVEDTFLAGNCPAYENWPRVCDIRFQDGLEQENSIPYMKLHGSCHWRTPERERVLIAGRDKVEDAKRFPLLGRMLDDLEEFCKDANVLVIGYGFLDKHINKALAFHGNRIFVVDPRSLPEIASPKNGRQLEGGPVADRFIGGRTRGLLEILGKHPKTRSPILEDIFQLITARP